MLLVIFYLAQKSTELYAKYGWNMPNSPESLTGFSRGGEHGYSTLSHTKDGLQSNNESNYGHSVEHSGYSPEAKPRRKIQFYTNKLNAGYLYNVGAKKFIAADSNDQWLMAVDAKTPPLLITIAPSYGHNIGTYMEILPIRDLQHPQLGHSLSNDYHAGIKRFDSGGDNNNKNRCYLYHETSVFNRYAITPPYYEGSTAFKILRATMCLGVDLENKLMEMKCVDDTTEGYGTNENDRQLFTFCPANSLDKCGALG